MFSRIVNLSHSWKKGRLQVFFGFREKFTRYNGISIFAILVFHYNLWLYPISMRVNHKLKKSLLVVKRTPFNLLASHCPEFESRWTHEYENVHIRVWSWKHRAIREAIFTHRVTAGCILQASAATSWAKAKSLACKIIDRSPSEGSFSCWLRVSILPFVRPS